MESIQKKFQIVVSRYNENVHWLKNYKEITLIYNKGLYNNYLTDFQVLQLPNFGRESHTYLTHIIENYDKLAEYTIFFQGNIKDHKPLSLEEYFQQKDFIGYLRNYETHLIKKPLMHFGKWKNEINNGSIKQSKKICFEWLKELIYFDENIKEISTVWGALFSVSRNLIHKKPKIFYEHLLRYVNYHVNPEEGHFFERCWYFIFSNDYIMKDIIKVKEIDYNIIDNDNDHYWSSLHDTLNLLINNKISKIILFPHYYFPINQNHIDFNKKSLLFFKIVIDDDLYFLIKVNHNQISILKNDLLLKESLFLEKDDFNHINVNFLDIGNKIEFVINNSVIYNISTKELKYFIKEKIQYFIKVFDYKTLIQLNNNTNSIIFVKQNNYFDIKHYYSNHYLDNFIQYT
jgi:hypothetical protein